MARFRREEADLFTFYRTPKELFTNPKYKVISSDTKLLYGFLLDRNSLSQQNGWVDKEGYVYIYFSREEAMELLGIARPKATSLFKELREVGLIEEVRQGLNKPNIIYVHKFIPSQNVGEMPAKPLKSMEVRKSSFQTEENLPSRRKKKLLQEVRKSSPNKTEINNTEEMRSSQLVSQSDPEDTNKTDGRTDGLTLLYQKIQIDLFHDGLRELFKDTIQELYIENPNQIAKLELEHVDEAWAVFKRERDKKEIKNPILYFKRCLLSAIKELPLKNAGYETYETPEPQKKVECRTGKEDVKSATSEEWQEFKTNWTMWSQETRSKLTGTAGTSL